MAKDYLLKWQRAGVLQSADVLTVQLDTMSPQVAAYYGGEAPYFRLYGFLDTTAYALAYKDLLIDTVNVDPITHQLAQYRIISDPEPFDDNHLEFVVDRMIGN